MQLNYSANVFICQGNFIKNEKIDEVAVGKYAPAHVTNK